MQTHGLADVHIPDVQVPAATSAVAMVARMISFSSGSHNKCRLCLGLFVSPYVASCCLVLLRTTLQVQLEFRTSVCRHAMHGFPPCVCHKVKSKEVGATAHLCPQHGAHGGKETLAPTD